MAPNFSKFYDDALKEGLGLTQFIERQYPNESDLKEIKPKMEMPYKGYFPAGKICKVFQQEFKRWTQRFSGKGHDGMKQKRILDAILLRMNKQNGLSLTKADLIVAGKGSAEGSNAGGGWSYIHPRLMTHFLQWCCPEFAEEVLDVFGRYLSGDASVIAESASLQNATLRQQLKASEDDKIKQQELLDQHITNYESVITTLQGAKNEICVQRDELTEELERLKTQEAEKYAEMVKFHAAKEQELQRQVTEAQEVSEDLDKKKRKLEDQMDADTARPLNVFKKAKVPLSEINRNNTFDFWFPARHITIDACIYFARKNYLYFAEMVTSATTQNAWWSAKAVIRSMVELGSSDPEKVKAERQLVKQKWSDLPENVQQGMLLRLYGRLKSQFSEVFNIIPNAEEFVLALATNNIKMYQLLCKDLKRIYKVQYSTQIDAVFQAKMAYNLNKYALGEFQVPLDSDYDEFDEDMLECVVLPCV